MATQAEVDALTQNLTDAETRINDEIKKGEHRTFDAQSGFVFKTIGNAAGVKITLNGALLRPLGSEGKVLHDRVFDRNSLPARAATETTGATTSGAAEAPRTTP